MKYIGEVIAMVMEIMTKFVQQPPMKMYGSYYHPEVVEIGTQKKAGNEYKRLPPYFWIAYVLFYDGRSDEIDIITHIPAAEP